MGCHSSSSLSISHLREDNNKCQSFGQMEEAVSRDDIVCPPYRECRCHCHSHNDDVCHSNDHDICVPNDNSTSECINCVIVRNIDNCSLESTKPTSPKPCKSSKTTSPKPQQTYLVPFESPKPPHPNSQLTPPAHCEYPPLHPCSSYQDLGAFAMPLMDEGQRVATGTGSRGHPVVTRSSNVDVEDSATFRNRSNSGGIRNFFRKRQKSTSSQVTPSQPVKSNGNPVTMENGLSPEEISKSKVTVLCFAKLLSSRIII